MNSLFLLWYFESVFIQKDSKDIKGNLKGQSTKGR